MYLYLLENLLLKAQLLVYVLCSSSLVQAKLRAVVQTHVGVTQQATGRLLQRCRVNSA